MESYVALAELRHFGRGAERMHMTQPAFSRQIQALESSLGMNLVIRHSQKVELTAAGEAFLDACLKVASTLDKGIERARNADRGYEGYVRVGYTDFAISGELPAFLGAFRRRYPRVVIEPFQGATVDLLQKVRDGGVDIAFVTGPIHEAQLVSHPFDAFSVLVVLWENHPLAARPQLSLHDLAAENFIFGVPHLWHHYLRHIDRLFADAKISPKISETAFNSEGLFGLIAAGLGITLYPDCARNYYRRGVTMRDLTGGDATIPVVAVWRDRPLPPALVRFHEALLEHPASPCEAARPEPPVVERAIATAEPVGGGGMRRPG